jgi:hypothetical protein
MVITLSVKGVEGMVVVMMRMRAGRMLDEEWG